MGLAISIYRDTYTSRLNVFNGVQQVVLVNVEGPTEPSDDRPAAMLVGNGNGSPIIRPLGYKGKLAFGGTYGGTSDSRLGEALREMGTHGYFAVPVHDYQIELEA